MISAEQAWLVVGFAVLPIAVLVVGFVLLMWGLSMQSWRRYAWLLGVAVLAWCVLTMVQSGFGPSEGSDAEELMFAVSYYLWPVLSLGAIVVGGSFWFLIGRAAALERAPLTRTHPRA